MDWGLWDDWSPIRARYKFILQIAATIPFVVLGPSIESLQCLGVRLELGMMAVPFTIFWIVSCANILNLIDGMDGLASSVGLIASATLATLFLSLNHLALATVGFVFVACLCGFLLHNWPPAKIFLGDSGSLTIGFNRRSPFGWRGTKNRHGIRFNFSDRAAGDPHP